jgi:hypothetical protein
MMTTAKAKKWLDRLRLEIGYAQRVYQELWSHDLLEMISVDLERSLKAAIRIPHLLNALDSQMSSFSEKDRLKAEELRARVWAQLPWTNPHQRRYGNPEIKKIMRERGVSRQRAHQIVKERQKA